MSHRQLGNMSHTRHNEILVISRNPLRVNRHERPPENSYQQKRRAKAEGKFDKAKGHEISATKD